MLRVWRIPYIVLTILLLAVFGPMSVRAQSGDDVDALNKQIIQLYGQEKYAKATALAQRALALAEKTLGKEHPSTITSLNNLALLYKIQGRYAEAEPLVKRTFEAAERVLGKEHPDTLASLNQLADLYRTLRRYGEAEPLYKRALQAREHVLGKEHPDTLESVHGLALLYKTQGRYGEAEPFYKRALEAAERMLGREHPNTLTSVNNLALLYQAERRYREAEALFIRALADRARVLGKEHPTTINTLNSLAQLYKAQGRYADAAPLYKRVLEVAERIAGKEHPSTLKSVNNLGEVYMALGRYTEAEGLFKRALEAYKRLAGPRYPETLRSANNLVKLDKVRKEHPEAEPPSKHAQVKGEAAPATVPPDKLASILKLAESYRSQGRYAEAEPLYLRALADLEKLLGPAHPQTLTSIHDLAWLYSAQGRYKEAETLYKRALAGYQAALGVAHPKTLANMDNLAALYVRQGRYAEAEPLFKRALAGYEATRGPAHADTLICVNNLAELYRMQERYAEAEPLYRRALKGIEAALGASHPQTLIVARNLAEVCQRQGRYPEAETLFKRALAGTEKALGGSHPNTFASIDGLAHLYEAQGRYPEAETLYKRELASAERALGLAHPATLAIVSNLAELYGAWGRYPEAEKLQKRALAGLETSLGAAHPLTLASSSNLGALYFTKRDWSRAAAIWRRGVAGITERTLRDASNAGASSKKISYAEHSSPQFRALVKAVFRLTPKGSSTNATASREMFQTAQWALSSEAAQSLAQMAARSAKGDGALAKLVRERQDLVAEWQKRDAWRNAALGQETAKRNAKAEAENSARLAAIDARIAEIDKRLKAKFPDYAALRSPAPISVEDVQAQLSADEALVLFLDTQQLNPTPEETFIWVVTKTDVRWVRSKLGTVALAREVLALRCGLDASAWHTPHCAKLLNADFTEADADAGKPLPFDHARAHALYKALFGQVDDIIKGKHLLIVPSGPLTQLPFQVLVTAPPANAEHKTVHWLVRDHAVTILPAVSSLKALRRVVHASTATKPLIGFGNPLLDGPQNDPRYGAYYKKRAKLARDNQQCRTKFQRLAALFSWRGVTPVETRSGLAQVSHIRMQAPLPETAGELCDVAHDLKADPTEMRLGARATEREVKRLSASGQLAHYRVVHFATHGTLAGELKGANEPGLLLTPPNKASRDDDGYLSASEIAQLKLDADWVILSACNTAAGDAKGAQALSGLARAFIYAQARALLVSHWAVNSDATVKLITGAMREMAHDSKVGRAEALRRSMLALIDKGDAKEAHPANWAPFIVVGEGGLR